MKRIHEASAGADTRWLPVSSQMLLGLLTALLPAACAAPIEASTPRAEASAVVTSTRAASTQASTLEAEEIQRVRWHALWLVAGGTPSPDLPAALASAREDRALIALELVREILEGPVSGSFREELADLLTGRGTDDLLWCCAARASARLTLHEVSSAVAVNLEASSAQRRVVAQEVLFALRGAWFQEAAEAGAHLGAGPPPDEAQLETLHAMSRRLREHATALYALDPAWAEAGLGDPDPELRLAAARALAAVLALQELPTGFDPGRARGALLGRLGEEEHAGVLHVLIEDFLEQLGRADACTREGRAFAGALHARVSRCNASVLAPLAHGLARMPLDPQLPAKDEAGDPDACSLAHAARALVGEPDESGDEGLLLSWMRPGRLVDPDALASALRSVEAFFERSPPGKERPELREVLLEAIEDPLRDAPIRAGAVRVLARAGRPEDLPRLGAVLTGAPLGVGFELVAYELIATITKLAEGEGPTTKSAIAARDALVAMLWRNEASLRRRALAMLATEPLAALAATTNAELLLAVLEQDLPSEDSQILLELLARRADPSLVPELLSSGAFDRLTAPTSGTASILTQTLGRLARGDGPLTHDVASRLIETRRSIGAAESEGVQRLRNALALLAALPESAAKSLRADQHADLVRWSIELREAAGTLAGVTAEEPPIAFLKRLTELHLVEGDPESAQEPWAHHTALLHADLFAALELDEEHPFFDSTTGYFHRAQEHALATKDELDEVTIYRDRARFYSSAGDEKNALKDYRKVVNEEASLGVSADSSILDLTDLRRAATLAAEETSADPQTAPTAFELTLALIGREFWRSEPAGVRLGDLRVLVERAGTTESNRASLRPFFDGLPPREIDLADDVLPADALWIGLQSDPDQLEVLRGLAAELESPAPVPVVPKTDAEGAPEEPETSEGVLEAVLGEDPPADT